MKKIMKRTLSLLLALVLVAGMVPHFALEAAAKTTTIQGITVTAADKDFENSKCTLNGCADNYHCIMMRTHSSRNPSFTAAVKNGNIWLTVYLPRYCEKQRGWVSNENMKVTFDTGVKCGDGCTGKQITLTGSTPGLPGDIAEILKSSSDGTFSLSITISAHDLENAAPSGNGTHSGKCTRCGETAKVNCSGGAATCTQKAKCTVCGQEYGDTDATKHVPVDAWTTENGKHYKACTNTDCTVHLQEANCTPSAATCEAASVCPTCGHTYAAKLDHNYTYAVAGDTITETCGQGCGHKAIASLTANTLTYNGAVQTGLTMTNPGWVGTAPVVSATAANAGTHTGTMTYTTTDGTALSASKKFTIAPHPIYGDNITVEFTPSSATYTGQAQKPVYTVKFNGAPMVEDTDYTAAWSVGDFTAAGEYQLVVTGKYGGNFTGTRSVIYTIGKAQPTCTAPTSKSGLAFSGAPQELITAGSAKGGTMYYRLGEDGQWQTEIPTAINAGEYDVYYRVAGDDNHSDTETMVLKKIRIENKSVDYVDGIYTAEGLVYNGAEQSAFLSEPKALQECTWNYIVTKPDGTTYESTSLPKVKEAGTYSVQAWYTPVDTNYIGGYVMFYITVGKAPLTLSIDGLPETGRITKVYDGTTALPEGHGLSIAVSGVQGSDIPTVTGTLAYASADAGETDIQAKGITLDEAYTANYILTSTGVSADAGEITRLTLDENAVAQMDPILWDGTEKTAELKTLTQNGLDVTYTLSGNKATDVGAYKMTVTGTGNFQGELELEFYIMPDDDVLKGLSQSNVTSSHQETIEKAKEMAETADTSGFPEEQKTVMDARLKEISDKADALQERLGAAADAANTQHITKAKGITADNAKVSDKKTLQDAKADLEAARNTYGTNYTAGEKFAINAEIDRIGDILANIARAEETARLVEELPKTVEPDDGKDWDAVQKAQAAYDELTDEQKKIVDNSTDGKLAKHQTVIRTIKVEKISATKWYKGSQKDIAITYDGPYANFLRLEVNGKTLDKEHYSVKEGSTVITLKASYLETLTSRKSYDVVAVFEGDKNAAATLTVIAASELNIRSGPGANYKPVGTYKRGDSVTIMETVTVDKKLWGRTDRGWISMNYVGRTDAEVKSEAATFAVYKRAGNSATGDLFSVGLWAGIGGISLLALAAVLVLLKKKEKK